MSTLAYHVDDFQVFKGVVVAKGWAFSRANNLACNVQIVLADNARISGELDWSPRPDVALAYPGAPQTCGFRIRAILPLGADVVALKMAFRMGNEELLVERPWDAAVALAYAPLDGVNQRFFGAVKQVSHPRVLEIGARARSGITRKQMFGENAIYTGLDIAPGENVDVVGDAHQLSSYFDASSFDFAYSVSVFEHLMWPWKVAIELATVLKSGGLLLMQSHAVWPKHEMPWDFFRFWDSGWRALFCSATGFEVVETVEAHPVSLVCAPFTGSYVHDWDEPIATLASSVLARKISEPSVKWDAVPDFVGFGSYPG